MLCSDFPLYGRNIFFLHFEKKVKRQRKKFFFQIWYGKGFIVVDNKYNRICLFLSVM
jgi:hypothetical protein